MTTNRPASLPFTGDPEADALLAADPLALLIGFTLDQQVTVQKAFAGPRDLRRRIGTLDAADAIGEQLLADNLFAIKVDFEVPAVAEGHVF